MQLSNCIYLKIIACFSLSPNQTVVVHTFINIEDLADNFINLSIDCNRPSTLIGLVNKTQQAGMFNKLIADDSRDMALAQNASGQPSRVLSLPRGDNTTVARFLQRVKIYLP